MNLLYFNNFSYISYVNFGIRFPKVKLFTTLTKVPTHLENYGCPGMCEEREARGPGLEFLWSLEFGFYLLSAKIA